MSDRPNFLFIITDQHRVDHLGCTGHPVLKTPHIDSIAAKGTKFDRFYVATPVCQPNRSTLLTGRMPSLHGVRSNGIPLDMRSSTFTEAMRQNRYATALVGKSHIQNMTGLPAMHTRPDPKDGYATVRDTMPEAFAADTEGDYDQEHPDRWRPGKPYDLDLPFYGFEHVDLCTEHSDHVGGQYYVWFKERRADADELRDRANQFEHDYICPQAYRTAIPEEFYPTSYIREKSLEYLDARAASDDGRPFFMMASFPDPHHPFTPPGKYWDMYKPEDMELPASFDYGNVDPPPHVKWARNLRDKGEAVVNSQSAFAVNEREVLEARALTCGMIAMIDDAVGAILAKLEETGLADNTIVVFTADHGDFLGDHGLMLKGPAHFEGVTHVPFIWSEPGATARSTDALGSTCDIAQTILDRAMIEPYNGIQGRSLLNAISGKDDPDAVDSVIVEDDQQRVYFGYSKPPRIRSLITERYRLTVSRGEDWGELYDLKNDPDEMENLFDDPAHAPLRAELFERLAHRQMELIDTSPMPTMRA
jgi:arylsulfatase A-like enzyme